MQKILVLCNKILICETVLNREQNLSSNICNLRILVELQIRDGIEDNSRINFLISQ